MSDSLEQLLQDLKPLEEEYERILGDIKSSVEKHIPNITNQKILDNLDKLKRFARISYVPLGTYAKNLRQLDQRNQREYDRLIEQHGGKSGLLEKLNETGKQLLRVRQTGKAMGERKESLEKKLEPIFQHNADPNNVQIRPENAKDLALKTSSPLSRLRYWFSDRYQKAYHVLEDVPEHLEIYQKWDDLWLQCGYNRGEESELLSFYLELTNEVDFFEEHYEKKILGDEKIREIVREDVFDNLLNSLEYARAFAKKFKDQELLCNIQRRNQIKGQIDRIAKQQQAAAVTTKSSSAPGCNF